ncbi:hypothetical protein [Roseivivax sp. THAF197b]|uniref:hypothetical protein n=1 Tax=Roseivivax sp. THAF197b TaxID=2588299 RepID=UPI0012690F34|nr:hypothetical protein [Roseivivax sp. THAF197b]QFS84835.1 hypothetical protein FIV09_18490 [Roseivivax sp. THAF197b]
MKIYLFGSQGAIGGHISNQLSSRKIPHTKVTRQKFEDAVLEILKSKGEILLINAAKLDREDAVTLAKSLERSEAVLTVQHLSSVAAETPSIYGREKLFEENIFKASLGANSSTKFIEIFRIGIPVLEVNGEYSSCGYWSNLDLDTSKYLISINRIPMHTFDVTTRGLVVTEFSKSKIKKLRNTKFIFLNLPKFLARRLPARRINSQAKFTKAQVIR